MRLLWYGTLMPGFGRVAQLCGLSEQALEAVLHTRFVMNMSVLADLVPVRYCPIIGMPEYHPEREKLRARLAGIADILIEQIQSFARAAQTTTRTAAWVQWLRDQRIDPAQRLLDRFFALLDSPRTVPSAPAGGRTAGAKHSTPRRSGARRTGRRLPAWLRVPGIFAQGGAGSPREAAGVTDDRDKGSATDSESKEPAAGNGEPHTPEGRSASDGTSAEFRPFDAERDAERIEIRLCRQMIAIFLARRLDDAELSLLRIRSEAMQRLDHFRDCRLAAEEARDRALHPDRRLARAHLATGGSTPGAPADGLSNAPAASPRELPEGRLPDRP
ncbi:MAG: hypothetical protein KDE35_14735 [Geminicoccaceae bacterium]|nr:hypothetical protein [Geminicoccaceae bacterium]